MAWIGRILGWVFAAIAAVLGLGAAFEAWMDFKARGFEPAGRMIAMGGARQHIHCLGEGRPTVILEAGAYSHSVNWALLHPQIAATHRVCAYDRPGLGWSEARPGPTDGPTRMRQLRALLDAADEKGPFVLVGHSYGGVLARAFLRDFPSDIVGLVAVDTASPGQSAQFADAQIALAPWVLVSEFLPPFTAHFAITIGKSMPRAIPICPATGWRSCCISARTRATARRRPPSSGKPLIRHGRALCRTARPP